MSISQNTLGPGEKRRIRPTAAVTVIEQIPVVLDEGERKRITDIGRCLLAAEPTLNATAAFGSLVTSGLGPWPTVAIEDHSPIALFEESGDWAYSYRSLLLAADGDIVLIGEPRIEAFEDYCRDYLKLGRVQILCPRSVGPPRPLAQRAAEDEPLIARLAERARDEGGLNLITYMGAGHVWKLAGRIAAASHRPIRVAAPPPRLTRRVNDKSWFTDRLLDVLGSCAAPPATAVYSLSRLASQVSRFVRRYPSVAVKLPDSASSAGNLVFDSRALRQSPLRLVGETLHERLVDLGWGGGFPLIVTAWEQPVLASPSTQLWVPAPDDGAPIVEGIFDQTIVGETAAFSGATPSTLPPAWQNRAATEAVKLGTLFQALGYFGRCSFDSILVGDDGKPAELHWVECNGRWGGVSIPMTLTNRLAFDWTRLPPVIIGVEGLSGRGCPMQEIISEFRDDLYRHGTRPNGLVILSPGRLVAGVGYEAMILEPSVAVGRARASKVAKRLLNVIGLDETCLHRSQKNPEREETPV
jgi:hypothetical protein